MEGLLLHPATKGHVAQFIAQPSHALLLIGAAGIGKTHLAQAMLQQILELDSDLQKSPYFFVVSDQKGSISIDAIRELQRFLQLKSIGNKPFRRAVIVEHADMLTIEAQNAFLKLLEEPPSDTILILTAANQRALLPTMLSRLQMIHLYPPEETALKHHFTTAGTEASAITQAYFLSGGLPGLMHALLHEEGHPLASGVANAKAILQKPLFERLIMAEGLSKQKNEALNTLLALQHIAQTGLDQAALKGDSAKIKQWHHILSEATQALEALQQNSNPKLTLTNLFLHL